MLERGPVVVVLELDPVEPPRRPSASSTARRLRPARGTHRDDDRAARAPPPSSQGAPSRIREPSRASQARLAVRLRQRATSDGVEQRLERCRHVDVAVPDDGLDRLERRPAENAPRTPSTRPRWASSSERSSRASREASVDARGGRGRRVRQRQPLAEACGYPVGPERPNPSGGELERERKPVERLQIRAIAPAFSSVITKTDRRLHALDVQADRRDVLDAPSGVGADDRGRAAAAPVDALRVRRSGARLVASTRSRPGGASRRATSPQRRAPARGCRARAASGARPASSRRLDGSRPDSSPRRARPWGRRAPDPRRPRGRRRPPAVGAMSRATASARRVFPVPPGPVSVTSRVSRRPGAGQAAISSSRPTSSSYRPGASPVDRGRRRRAGERCRVVAEDLLLERAQLGRGLETELVESGPCVAVGGERVRLATRTVEGEHLVGAKALAMRMGRDESLELGGERVVSSGGEVGGDAGLERAESRLLEPGSLRLGKRLEARRRRAPVRARARVPRGAARRRRACSKRSMSSSPSSTRSM